ncbi:N-acetylmuramoyl-L-alanine amidase [Salinisphaera hydrothermalis]|uniref:N-acetylmuramoyl-L-alanine amidase n=1 Tax=Salinisphaera hydrothermalis (strain C41B8) TaxID=1304275 RepID=A0A084IG64_SALHC|nr:N-acetylmuramoyl-L-alanine amidase [Salinisphaera hydrothermalis]KEZ75698.1 N-acetylmuramoyl-L-alanine amidase [Salinisphaera hydrothermalis C41B8]
MNRFLCYRRAWLVLPLLLWSAAAAATATLQHVVVHHDGGHTRVIMRFSKTPAFNDFVLSSPVRAVIDMNATRRAKHTAAKGEGAVRDVRWGRRAHGTLRAVFDLAPGTHFAGVTRHGRELVARFDRGESSGSAGAPSRPPIVVVIDPGHGGKDPGTSGPHGLREKTVVLSIGRMVYDKLAATPGIKPVLTRHDDHFVTLADRVAIAQHQHADVFVSIHANASPGHPDVDGGTCYELSEHGASNAEAAQLAHFENSRDREVAGVRFSSDDMALNTVLTQMFQSQSINAADRLAQRIIHHFGQIEPLYHAKPLRANFEVLRDPMVVSVLCETAFLSNPTQAEKLHGHAFRAQLANAIYEGIVGYLKHNPPMHPSPTSPEIYIAKQDDTLDGIAARAGTTPALLMAINDLGSRRLEPGQRLIVPGLDDQDGKARLKRYKVQKGDTLYSIATAHDETVAALKSDNALDSTRLRVGQVLRVPPAPNAHGDS